MQPIRESRELDWEGKHTISHQERVRNINRKKRPDAYNWHLDPEGVEVAKGQGEGVPDTPEHSNVTATATIDHIRDLHDAATRFEDRAKRAEAHAERLAEALRDMLADSRSLEIRHYAKTQLAAWEGAQK